MLSTLIVDLNIFQSHFIPSKDWRNICGVMKCIDGAVLQWAVGDAVVLLWCRTVIKCIELIPRCVKYLSRCDMISRYEIHNVAEVHACGCK